MEKKRNHKDPTEPGIYIILNDMRGPAEGRTSFGPFENKLKAESWMGMQLAPEPYTDEGPNLYPSGPRIKTYHKRFEKGSELEWMNPLTDAERATPGTWAHGFWKLSVVPELRAEPCHE
jgi:hypothetical protein